MPTAAKLVGAFAFALLAFFTAQIVVPHLPEGTKYDYMWQVAAVVGMACGWMIMGPMTRRGYVSSVGSGMKTAVIATAWALLVYAIGEMLRQTLRNMYDGPMEAVVDIARIFIKFGAFVLFPDVLAVLLVGGGLAGMLTEWAAKRWD